MPRKRYKPEEIVAKLRQVDVLVSQGQSLADAIRQTGVSEVTYYRWRQEFGGLKTEQIKRLKDLELECQRQWETDPVGNSNLTHPPRWFLREGGADANGGGKNGVGRPEETRCGHSGTGACYRVVAQYGAAVLA
jgi:putative transposase